jgi:hypothetical protein
MFRRLLAIAIRGRMLPLDEKCSPTTVPVRLSSSSRVPSTNATSPGGLRERIAF